MLVLNAAIFLLVQNLIEISPSHGCEIPEKYKDCQIYLSNGTHIDSRQPLRAGNGQTLCFIYDPNVLSTVNNSTCAAMPYEALQCRGNLYPVESLDCLKVFYNSSQKFTCHSGNPRQIPISMMCDGDTDCDDGSDEAICETGEQQKSGFSYFRCNRGNYVSISSRCNLTRECPDNSDELYCSSYQCPDGMFKCANKKCIPADLACNGANDCFDFSDEHENCSSSVSAIPPPLCSGLRKCRNGTCLAADLICDGHNDCGDGRDEMFCLFWGRTTTNIAMLPATTTRTPCTGFQCASTPEKCIHPSYTCDGDDDCGDGSDEANCTSGEIENKGNAFSKCGTHIRNNWRSIKISRGSEAKYGEYPWMAWLRVSYRGTSKKDGCGASLISNQWMLTAAHCVTSDDNLKLLQVEIILGVHNKSDLTEPILRRSASRVVKHPGFRTSDNNLEYDLALLKLDRTVQFRKNIRPICLPGLGMCKIEQAGGNASCKVASVAGWGFTEQESSSTGVLRHSKNVTIRPQSACDRGPFRLGHTSICAGNGISDTCHGDSGGPLMCERNGRTYQIGVTSWGMSKCDGASIPSVYSRVCSAINWIEDTIYTT